jgi:hypothetical protein
MLCFPELPIYCAETKFDTQIICQPIQSSKLNYHQNKSIRMEKKMSFNKKKGGSHGK